MAIWADIRQAIVDVLEEVEITDPVLTFTKHVYATPPKGARNLSPCWIIMPPAVTSTRGLGAREDMYTVRCVCLIKDSDLDQAMAMADELREATLAAFDETKMKLGSGTGLGVIISQTIEEPGLVPYGGIDYTGFNCVLTVRARPAFTPPA